MENRMQVALRLRPLLSNALIPERKSSVYIYNGNVFTEVDCCKFAEKVLYDHLFVDTDDNKKVYETVKPMVESFIHGTNGTVFLYGSENSGKNHTLYGTSVDLGIVQLMLNELTSHISMNEDIQYTLKAAFVEVAEDDKLLDLQDVVNQAFARKGIKFTNDLKDLLERGRYMYKSHNHVILSFSLKYIKPEENDITESQFNFVILADPTGKDTDKDHNHFKLSLLFTYLHLLSINDNDFDMGKMLLSSVLSKTVGKNGKSLFIATLSPTDPKKTLYTIKKIKLIKDPDVKNLKVSTFRNQLPDILIDEFKVEEASCDYDSDDMEDQDDDDDSEEQDFVTRIDEDVRVYVTEIPPEYYRQLNPMGLLITNDQTKETSSFFVCHQNDKIGTAAMAFLPDDLLPTTLDDHEVLYNNEIFVKICRDEHKLQVYLNKLRGTEPLDPENPTDFDLQELLTHQVMDPITEEQIENEFEYVAGCSIPKEAPNISNIEFKNIDKPRTDYGSEAECRQHADEQADIELLEYLSREDENETSESIRLKQHMQRLLKQLDEHKEYRKQLEHENKKMRKQLDQQMKKNMEQFHNIRKIKSTLYSMVNKEVYKAKFIYKSNIKVYDKFYKYELGSLKDMFVESQDYANKMINDYEEAMTFRSFRSQGKKRILVPQGTAVVNVNTELDEEQDKKRNYIMYKYYQEYDEIMKKVFSEMEKMQKRIHRMAQMSCGSCFHKHDYFNAENEYYYEQNKMFTLNLSRACTIMKRNKANIADAQKRNRTLHSDNKRLKMGLENLYRIRDRMKDKFLYDNKPSVCRAHFIYLKNTIVKTSLYNLIQLEKEILEEINSKTHDEDSMDSDSEEEDDLSQRLEDLRLPRTPMDDKLKPTVRGLVNTAVIMEDLVDTINIIYNNMHRFLNEKDGCANCLKFENMLHYKIIQLVALKSRYSFWSKNITMEDTSIDFYLQLTTELQEMASSISDSKRLKLLQYKLLKRKIYFENCLTDFVNKRNYVDHVLTILIDASSECQDMLKEEEGNNGHCKFRTTKILISMLFSLIRERIVITLFYLDNIENLKYHKSMNVRVNELDIAIAKNEKCLRDIFPVNKDLPEMKDLEMEHAYLIALYNVRLLRILELEKLLKVIPQQRTTQLPKEFALALASVQSALNPSPYDAELHVTTAEPPPEIPICTEVIHAKRLVYTSTSVGTKISYEPQIVLNNLSPNEFALKMLGDCEQMAIHLSNAGPLKHILNPPKYTVNASGPPKHTANTSGHPGHTMNTSGPPEHTVNTSGPPEPTANAPGPSQPIVNTSGNAEQYVRKSKIYNPRKRPLELPEYARFRDPQPIPSTSQAIVPPPQPRYAPIRFKVPAARASQVKFKPKYQVQNDGHYAIRSRPMFNDSNDYLSPSYLPKKIGRKSAGPFDNKASTSAAYAHNKFIIHSPVLCESDESDVEIIEEDNSEEENCQEENYQEDNCREEICRVDENCQEEEDCQEEEEEEEEEDENFQEVEKENCQQKGEENCQEEGEEKNCQEEEEEENCQEEEEEEENCQEEEEEEENCQEEEEEENCQEEEEEEGEEENCQEEEGEEENCQEGEEANCQEEEGEEENCQEEGEENCQEEGEEENCQEEGEEENCQEGEEEEENSEEGSEEEGN